MIAAVVERCAGIDVAKKFLKVCVMVGPLNEEPRCEIRKIDCSDSGYQQWREWLKSEGVTHVVMESTGPYWVPVFNILEGDVKVVLANPVEVKNRKGHKTDATDAWWLAHLLRHGMIRPSFIPPREIRELRELTRRRRQLLNAGTAESPAKGSGGSEREDRKRPRVTGQAILEALLEGKASSEEMAHLARGLAKRKIPSSSKPCEVIA